VLTVLQKHGGCTYISLGLFFQQYRGSSLCRSMPLQCVLSECDKHYASCLCALGLTCAVGGLLWGLMWAAANHWWLDAEVKARRMLAAGELGCANLLSVSLYFLSC